VEHPDACGREHPTERLVVALARGKLETVRAELAAMKAASLATLLNYNDLQILFGLAGQLDWPSA